MSKTKVVHCKISPYDVLIDRSTKWGNPFSHKEKTKAQFVVETREEAVAKYREWIQTQPDLLKDLPSLKGKILGCWCKTTKNPNDACHGDVLAELADAIEEQDGKENLGQTEKT